MSNDYYYNETVTRFYDPVYAAMKHLKSETDFYLHEIKNTDGAVLEAGVGTGRIFVPALEGGADIYGVDYSENMLMRLKEKISAENYYRLSQNDIRNFSLDKKFQLVVSPFRVFQHLLTVEDQLKTLNCIYEHLEEGGRLIFDVFNPDFRRMIKPADNLLEFDGEYEAGQSLKRYCTVKYDYTEQQMNIKFVFVWVENGVVKTDTFSTPLRYYFRYELENLIGRTKFKLEKIYGDFNKNELNEKSNEFIVVCRK